MDRGPRAHRRDRRCLGPESLVGDVIARLRVWGATHVREIGKLEDVTFALPKELRIKVVA